MRRYKTEELTVKIRLVKPQPHEQVVNIEFNDGGKIEEDEVVLPAKICKQNFNDSHFAKHILNFFIKD